MIYREDNPIIKSFLDLIDEDLSKAGGRVSYSSKWRSQIGKFTGIAHTIYRQNINTTVSFDRNRGYYPSGRIPKSGGMKNLVVVKNKITPELLPPKQENKEDISRTLSAQMVSLVKDARKGV